MKTMTTKQTFSRLAIAATALLAAAVPAFAQSRSVDSSFATSGAVTQTRTESVVAFNSIAKLMNIYRTGTKGSVAEPAIKLTPSKTALAANSRPDLSLAKFMSAGSQKSLSMDSGFTVPRTTVYDTRTTLPTHHFNADEDSGSRPRKAVSFVPSRGQKLPDSEIVAW